MDKRPNDAQYLYAQELAEIFLSYSERRDLAYKLRIRELYCNSGAEFLSTQAERLLFRLRRNLRCVDSQINVKANELNDPKLSPEGLVGIHRRANIAFRYMDKITDDMSRLNHIIMALKKLHSEQAHEGQAELTFKA